MNMHASRSVRWIPTLAAAMFLFLGACIDSPQQPQAKGGDDMDNFVGRVLDSSGKAVSGKVVVRSDVDTLEVFVSDDSGTIRIPGRQRAWIRFLVDGVGEFHWDSPPSKGWGATMKVGKPRPLIGGFAGKVERIWIPGVAMAYPQPGFWLDSVPPGRMQLFAELSTGATASMVFVWSVDVLREGMARDRIVLPALVVVDSSLKRFRESVCPAGKYCVFPQLTSNLPDSLLPDFALPKRL